MDKNKPSSIKTSFFENTIEYQPLNAYWMGQCATYAYKGAGTIKSKAIGEWGFDNIHFISHGDTQCFIASTDKFVVLAFRGTEVSKYKDLITDADLSLIEGYGGKVHKGFKQAYGSVRNKVEETLKTYNAAVKTVWITGHSLGGALAVLAAYKLKEQGYNVSGIYTMGQPRVGNSAFANAFEKRLKDRCFRFIDTDDKVPEVPLKSFGYEHVGQAIYIAPKNRLALHYKRSKNVINIAVSAEKSPSAHSSDKYAEAIAKNVGYNPFANENNVIKEKPVVNVEKEASKAGKTVTKGASTAAKAVGKESKKAGKSVGKLARKGKKIF